ncbi:unnamed protein product [Dicrocoelium dendriticum]|nr:unnamed protein product [Dicrocoelium dendriticum]
MAKERMVQLGDVNRKQKTRELGTCKRKSRSSGFPGVHNSGAGFASEQLSNSSRGMGIVHQTDSPSLSQVHSDVSEAKHSSLLPNPSLHHKTLRERVVHILALRPYGRPELLLRLTRDGLTQSQKNELDDVLSKVGRMNRSCAYSLDPSAISELDTNWPGFSTSERNRIILLKESKHVRCPLSENSPSSLRPLANPPCNSSSPAQSFTCQAVHSAEDVFVRRPTRASAPVAPHSLSKMIAALDLLASGVNPAVVAERLSVSHELLEKWRTKESQLRERQHRLRHNVCTDSTNSVTTDSLALAAPSRIGSQRPKRNYSAQATPPTISPSSAETASCKRTRFDPLYISMEQKTTGVVGPESQSKGRSSPGSPLFLAYDRQHSNLISSNDWITPNRTELLSNAHSHSNLRDSLPTSLCLPTRQSRFCSLSSTVGGSCGGVGSEGESAPHTPYSNVSSGGSDGHAAPVHLRASSLCVPFTDRDPVRVQLNSSRPSSSTSYDLDDGSYMLHLSSGYFRDSDIANPTTQQPTNLSTKVTDAVSGTSMSSDIPALAELNRLFPKITHVHQVESYVAEFQSTYPTYLRMYHSLQDICRDIRELYSRLLDMTTSNEWDSPVATDLADQLEKFLERTRTPKYRDDHAQLTMIAQKLRLLKHRLSESRRDFFPHVEHSPSEHPNTKTSTISVASGMPNKQTESSTTCSDREKTKLRRHRKRKGCLEASVGIGAHSDCALHRTVDPDYPPHHLPRPTTV